MSDLVKTNEQALAVPAAPDVLAGLVRLKPTMIELVALTSTKPGAIPGKFRDSVTQEHYESITVVPLTIFQGRQKFPPFEPGSINKPECYSRDGIVPHSSVENPLGRTCGECKYSKWGQRNPATGKATRPACDETFTMLVILKESQLPRKIQFKGAAITPFKEFMHRLETDRIQVKGTEGRKPDLHEYFFTIEPFRKSGNGRVAFIPLFTKISRVKKDTELFNQFGQFYQQYVNYQNDEYEDDPVDIAIDQIGPAATPQPEVITAEFVEA